MHHTLFIQRDRNDVRRLPQGISNLLDACGSLCTVISKGGWVVSIFNSSNILVIFPCRSVALESLVNVSL